MLQNMVKNLEKVKWLEDSSSCFSRLKMLDEAEMLII